MNLKDYIREFQDFPITGVNFKDISTLLKAPEAMNYIADQFSERFQDKPFDIIAGAESRGLIFASSLAAKVDKGYMMVRKKGKLPGPTVEIEYGLEYAEGVLEIQQDSVRPGDKVLIVDDLLATGGTARAAAHLIEKLGGTVVGFAFVIELDFLNGREVIGDYDIQSLVNYNE